MSSEAELLAAADVMQGWTKPVTEAVTINWPNQKYDPNVPGYHVKIRFQQGTAFQMDIGSPESAQHRQPGVLFLQVFVPTSDIKLSRNARKIADSLASRFKRAHREFTDGSIQWTTPTVRDVGEDGTGKWQVNVVVPYRRDNL